MISREIQTRKDNNRAIQINKEIQRTKMIIRESVNVQNETTQWLLFNPTITSDLFSWLHSILLNDFNERGARKEYLCKAERSYLYNVGPDKNFGSPPSPKGTPPTQVEQI